MTETSKSSGAQSQPGSQSSGADQAKAYVPPQVLKAKPKGQVHGAKVEIKAGVDPRRAKTVVGMGVPVGTPGAPPAQPATQPALPTPPEVLPYQMATTPPGGVAAAVVVDGALPFKPAAAVSAAAVSAAAVSAAAVSAHAAPSAHGGNGAGAAGHSNGFEYPTGPKSPPLKLHSPGELLALSAPVGGAAAAHASGDAHASGAVAAAVPAAAAPAAEPVAQPQPDLSATPPPVVVDTSDAADAAGAAGSAASPWGGAASAPPAAEPDEGIEVKVEADVPAGEHALATTNSPWTSAHSVDVEVLPSTSMLTPPATSDAEPIQAVTPEDVPKTSSLGMTIGLALAALALVGALAYFIFAKDGGGKDPADVKVGTEQKQYNEPATAQPVETVTAQPTPKPTFKPPPPPVTTAAPVVPKRPPKPVDIYEDY